MKKIDVRERGEGGDVIFPPTSKETPMDALICAVDEYAGVVMAGFVSDGLGLSLLLRNLFLMR